MNGTSAWKNLPAPVRIALGSTLVGLGVLGLFLPFLQGILFISIGLTVLARDIPWIRRGLDRLRATPAAQRVRGRFASLRRTFRR